MSDKIKIKLTATEATASGGTKKSGTIDVAGKAGTITIYSDGSSATEPKWLESRGITCAGKKSNYRYIVNQAYHNDGYPVA